MYVLLKLDIAYAHMYRTLLNAKYKYVHMQHNVMNFNILTIYNVLKVGLLWSEWVK